jgi:hypothetical protein
MLRQENKRFRLDQKCSGLAPLDWASTVIIWKIW